MNKIASLLCISLTFNAMPLQSMQRSFLSKQEARQARRMAEQNAQFWAKQGDQDGCTSSLRSIYTPKSHALICLLMVYLLLWQTQAAPLLSDSPAHDDGHRAHTGRAVSVAPHYITESTKEWLNRLSHEAWADTFHPNGAYTIEEFIGGLVRCARDGGKTAVIDFLEKAEDRGFALDFCSYEEERGKGTLMLIHLMARNNFKYTAQEQSKHLAESIRNIDSIISNRDVRQVNGFTNGNCYVNDECFGFIPKLSFELKIPLVDCKPVDISVRRGYNDVPAAKKTEQDEQREDL
jgi:hypothetical protein